MRACDAVARRAGLLVLPLHGSLPPKEQDRALAPASQRKLILATNVAESSITVEGVTAVIDSGLARFASYSPWSGLPTLHVGRVSKASAKQRAGRAGRTAPGRVLRLYTEEDYSRRPDHDAPEILRSDLSQLCLALRAMRIAHVNDIAWLDAPAAAAVERAESLLDRLGASGDDGAAAGAVSASSAAVANSRGGCWSAVWVRTAVLRWLCSGSGVRVEKNDLLAAMDLEPDHRVQQHIAQLRRIARISGQTKHNDDALLDVGARGIPGSSGAAASREAGAAVDGRIGGVGGRASAVRVHGRGRCRGPQRETAAAHPNDGTHRAGVADRSVSGSREGAIQRGVESMRPSGWMR